MKQHTKIILAWIVGLLLSAEVSYLLLSGFRDYYSDGAVKLEFFPMTCIPSVIILIFAVAVVMSQIPGKKP